MRRRKREEQEFLEKIDRLLEGEEVSIVEDADEDLRTAIEFSRSLSGLYPGPSPEFGERLRARLLLKLTEQEAAARQKITTHWFWDTLARMVPQSPVWRTAAVTLVMVVAVVTVMWRAGMFGGVPGAEPEGVVSGAEKGIFTMEAEEEAAVEAPRAAVAKEVQAPPPSPEITLGVPPILLQVTPAEPVIAEYGHEVRFELVFRNTSEEMVTVSPFPPRFTIVGGEALRPVRILPEGDITLEMGVSGTILRSLTWDQRDDAGAQVAPGRYTIYVGTVTVLRDGESTGMQLPSLPPVLVQYPQGAMEKSLEVGRSLTVSEVTVTLEQVELSALGAAVYVSVSPGYGAPEEGGPGLPTTGVAVEVTAWYSVDAGPAEEARDPGERFLKDEDRTRLSWEHLDPVPSDAKSLSFTVLQIGEWQGPWEFHISLQD